MKPNAIPACNFFLFLFFPVTVLLAQTPDSDRRQSHRDSSTVISVDSLDLIYFQRRQRFIQSILDRLVQDSTALRLNFSRKAGMDQLSIGFSDTSQAAPPPERDYIQEEFMRQHTDLPTVLDLGALARSLSSLFPSKGKATRPKLSDLPLPNEIELKVLTAVWDYGVASNLDLYAKLSGSMNITAEMLWNVLRDMARKGYLEEKQISPRQPLTLLTPFGAKEIEMSGKNAKNRVFLYRPLFNQDEILHYLIARRYTASANPPAANGRTSPQKIDVLLSIFMEHLRKTKAQ